MNIREISDIFKDTAADITALKSYNFGWASDRVRQGNTEDFQELNEFPRVFFAVPTITGSDQTRKQDTYQVTLFFDDLLGYDNEGDEDPTLQIDKWANLQQYANYFVQRLNKIKQSILPNYLFIPEAPSITFDSFTGLQRMITVQLSFNLVVPTNCDPSIITLVQCIANIVTSSNLTASLTTVLKFAASLEGRATVTADINFVQKAEASLLTSANVTGNITIPKTFNASLLATGTTTADLTVQAAGLLLDLYPDAATAYSLRKLRTAYSGSAVRVRRSSDNTEQDIGFVGNDLDTTALTTFCGAGNGFVTTWYDQSGNARNAINTTQVAQPIIVSGGLINVNNGKPSIYFNGVANVLVVNPFTIVDPNLNFTVIIATKVIAPTNNKWIFNVANASTRRVNLTSDGRYTILNPSTVGKSISITPNSNNLFFVENTPQTLYTNNILATGALSNTGINDLRFTIGGIFTSTTLNSEIDLQEFIIYPINQSNNRTDIQNIINTYYCIY